MPGFDWNAFFAGAQIPTDKTQALVVVQPSYFEALGKLIATTSSGRLARLLPLQAAQHVCARPAGQVRAAAFRLHPAHRLGHRSSEAALEASGGYGRWCAVGDLVGKMYVERHFSPDAKRRMDELVGNLMAAYRQGIDSLGMDDAGHQTKGARQARTLHHQDRLSVEVALTGRSSRSVATI